MAHTWPLEVFDPITNENILETTGTGVPATLAPMTSLSTSSSTLSNTLRVSEQHELVPIDLQGAGQPNRQFTEQKSTNTCIHWDQEGAKHVTVWTDLEGETIMALFHVTHTSIEEKQRAVQIACGTHLKKYDLNFVFRFMLQKEMPVLPWHFPREWTFLEFKLLRKEVSIPDEVSYESAAKNMNDVRTSMNYKRMNWWRSGGSYTGDELRLATRHLFWRLPNLHVRASAAWLGVEDRQFLISYTLCQPLARLTKGLSNPPGQFLPNARNEIPYDRLSVERHIDDMLMRMPPLELRERFCLTPSDLHFFGVLGDGDGLGPAHLEPWGVV